jgi:hypothetical protein
LGLRGPNVNTRPIRARPIDDRESINITPQAIAIYRRMRRYERQHGPGGKEWWAMNAKLADCFGLFGGMVVYEDPAWEYNRPFPSDLARFDLLEAASKAKGKPKKFRYKWEA